MNKKEVAHPRRWQCAITLHLSHADTPFKVELGHEEYEVHNLEQHACAEPIVECIQDGETQSARATHLPRKSAKISR